MRQAKVIIFSVYTIFSIDSKRGDLKLLSMEMVKVFK